MREDYLETWVEWVPKQKQHSVGGCTVCGALRSEFLLFVGEFRMQLCREHLLDLHPYTPAELVDEIREELERRLSPKFSECDRKEILQIFDEAVSAAALKCTKF